MRKLLSICSLFSGLLALSAGCASAGTVYDLTWLGNGNSATATGTITLETGNINNPGFSSQSSNSFVTDFTMTIAGADIEADNGTFTFADFNGSGLNGGFLFNASTTVDFNTELIGQIDDFNIFTNGTNASAPNGTSPLMITTPNGGQSLQLTSFAPATAAPEPSSLALVFGSVAFLGFRLRRRK